MMCNCKYGPGGSEQCPIHRTPTPVRDKDYRTTKLEHERKTLIGYLKSKTDAEDWHAVSDAANDLRVLDAQIAERKKSND